MKAKIWVLCTVLADENAPAMPTVFADEAEAWAKYDEMIRAEWGQSAPTPPSHTLHGSNSLLARVNERAIFDMCNSSDGFRHRRGHFPERKVFAGLCTSPGIAENRNC